MPNRAHTVSIAALVGCVAPSFAGAQSPDPWAMFIADLVPVTVRCRSKVTSTIGDECDECVAPDQDTHGTEGVASPTPSRAYGRTVAPRRNPRRSDTSDPD